MAAVSTFLQETVSTSNLTVYTFSSQNLGTASSDRYIVVAVNSSRIADGTSSATVTVQGISATLVKAQPFNSVGSGYCALFIVAVPTGTTGDVVVTCDSANARCGIGLYAVTGIDSATPHATGGESFNESTVTPDPSADINVEAGGIIIATSSTQNQGTPTVTWTGPTEDYDTAMESNSIHSGANDEYVSASTPETVTASWTSTTGAGMACASWSPVAGATQNSNFLQFMR